MIKKIITRIDKIMSNFLINKLYKYYLIFIFISLFSSSFNQNEIDLIVKGTGNHYFLNQYFYKAPSIVIINGNEIGQNIRIYDFERELNDVTIKFDSQIDSCEVMFFGTTNIIEIDLSKLNTSNITNMACMFLACGDLEKITFGNINTSVVNTMDSLFRNCSRLKSLDLSNFDTSLVTNMYGVFSHCESLTSVNLEKFNTLNVEIMYDMFAFCYKLTSLDLSNFNVSKVRNMQGMFYHCHELKYLDLSNFDSSSVTKMQFMFEFCNSLIYINLLSFKITSVIDITSIFYSTSPNVKICINDSETINSLQSQGAQIQNFNCSDICFDKNTTLYLSGNIYVEDRNPLRNKKYRYKFNCYEKCPNTTYVSKNNENECLEKTKEGNYYFNINKGVYEECYSTCKKCEVGGNEIDNNCTECKNNFNFLNDSYYKSNCYQKCQNYYYFDELKNYKCTEKEQCPEKYNKLIKEKNKCIDECVNDNIFKYEYNNTCLESCPNNTKEINNICLDNEISEGNDYIKVFHDYITYTDIPKNVTESKKDYIREKNNTLYQITTTENQKNNIYDNISTINLEACESILREKYDINEKIPLIILKIDYKLPGLLIPIIGYEIYHPINKTKLNLADCKDIKLNIPVKINEKELFKYDPKSDYYNDDCSPYTTENGTDIMLNDRKQEFKDKNLSLCQNNCEYIGYDYKYKQSSCKCIIKNKIDSISAIVNNSNNLANPFHTNESEPNFLSSSVDTVKCTNTLFSKEGIISNISSYIIFIIIIQFMFSIIFFIKCGYNLIQEDITKILDFKKEEEKEKNQNFKTPMKEEHSNEIFQNFPPKKKKKSNINLKVIKKNNKKSNKKENFFVLNDKSVKENIIQKQKAKNDILTKNEMNYICDFELNTFNFEKAISLDKRSCSKYYLSLLKTKHPLIFSFFPIKDYNNMIIKICIFSLSYSVYYTINYAFFNYKVIHKLYIEGGKYDAIYFIPKIIISFCISHITIIPGIFSNGFFQRKNLLTNDRKKIVSSLSFGIFFII